MHLSGITALDRTLTAAWLKDEVSACTRADDLDVARAIALAVRGRQKSDLTMQQRLRTLRAVVFSRDRHECVVCGYGRRDTGRPDLALAFLISLTPEIPRHVFTVCPRCRPGMGVVNVEMLQRFWRPGLTRHAQAC